MSPIDWSSSGRNKANPANGTSQTERPEAGHDSGLRRAEAEEARLAVFAPQLPKRKLANLILDELSQGQLSAALAKIRHHDKIYKEWDLQSVHPEGRGLAINLYGPPGTGKSFAAEAIADHLGRSIIRVDYAQIESRYVGETPKNIVAAFQAAAHHDALLFFDEADSVLSRRLSNITQAADYSVNVTRSTMLLELDSFRGVVIFATNLAAQYDPAFVRRILAHIHFPLPGPAARAALWQAHLPAKMPLATDVDLNNLVQSSEGFSGSDILNAVILAAANAAQREAHVVAGPDFAAALAQVQQSKTEVGNGPAFSIG
jgi:ATP-dependent 26S proteasome regulatory subunit